MPVARAVRISRPGGPEVLELGPLDVRDPGPGEVLVRVEAAGLNRADVLQRLGRYPAPPGVPPEVPGLEYAGVVAACGEGVEEPAVGERVMGIVGGGAMATHLVVHARETIPMPDGLAAEEAAAVPEVFITAWDALFRQAEVRLGEVVLVHAIGSGVGTAALQLLLLAGARPVGTSRSPEKLDRAAQLGMPAGLEVREGRFAEALRHLTGGGGAQVVLDTVGAAYLEENLRAVERGGRIVVVGLLGGVRGELTLARLLSHRITLRGTVLRSRPLEEKIALAQAFRSEVLPHLSEGRLRPIVHAVLPMTEVCDAHRQMEADANFGKIVLRW